MEIAAEGLNYFTQGVVADPAYDDGIVTGGDDDDAEKEGADVFSAGEAAYLEGSEGSALRMAAEGPFAHKGGDADEQYGEEIDEDEGGSAEFFDHVGEAPDVAQADGDADHGH